MKAYFEGFLEAKSRPMPCILDDFGPDGDNGNLIYEAGLARLLSQSEKNDWAIMSAYRGEFDKKQNIRRNRDLRAEFNKRKMGVYQLVGHWRECQVSGVEYKDCPKNKLKDVIERSYMVVRPASMTAEAFEQLILSLVKKFNQDAGLIKLGSGPITAIEKSGSKFPIGTGMTLGKVAQAYSQHVKKMDVPFTFEGVEVPGTVSGRRLFKEYGILYPSVVSPSLVEGHSERLKTWSDLVTVR